MNTRHATGDSNAALADQGSGSIEAWLGIEAIAKALKGSTNVSAAGLKSVLDSATGLDVGLIPPWTPSSPGPAGFARVSNTSEYFSNISNGKAVLTSPTPTDIGPFLK
jgi:hypothetical protein